MSIQTQQTPLSVAVVGGGVTGLSAAEALHRAGQRVELFESSARLGGSIGTERVDGWLVEAGPNSLMSGEPELESLIDRLGLRPQVVSASPSAKKRFIVREGRLRALPMSPPALLLSGLFSWAMKRRIFGEYRYKPRVRPEDVSLECFIRDHFGQEAVDYGLNPFVSGVYAGDPARLSARHSFPKLWEIEGREGSIIRGQIAAAKRRKAEGRARPGIVSFEQGLQVLIDALGAQLPKEQVHLSSPVSEIRRQGKTWLLRHRDGETCVDRVVLTAPAHALARIEIEGGDSLTPLAELPHPPVTSLFLGYKRTQVGHPLDGFGALVPAVEKRKILGVLFSSSLFPGRAPEGHVALTVMVGGTRQPELAGLSLERLLHTIGPDLRELLGVQGDPTFLRRHDWPAAIPQYNLGHQQYLDCIAAHEAAHPGLFIGGNCRDGIAAPACVAAGQRLARAVLS